MLSFIRRLRLASLFPVILALPAFAAQSEPPPASNRRLPNEIVIKGGMLELNGERTPATVRRVVDAIAPIYRRMTVRMVGAENVVIQDVTLQLPRSYQAADGKFVEPSLHSLFAALQAASGNRFKVQAFGEQDFVLTADTHYINAGRTAEVFKLTPLLASAPAADGSPNLTTAARPDATLQRLVDQLETELSDLRTRFTENHPSVVELLKKIEAVRQRQRDTRSAPPPDAAQKLIEQIQDVVRTTLKSLKPGEPMPEFKFHRGTGLLVVIGSDEAIAITRKVIDALN